MILKNAIDNDETKIIYLYRYFSLGLTSLFYLFGNLRSPLNNKIIVIVCLTIASIFINNLYVKNKDTKKVIIILVSIETIGNLLILIPTGGLNSPYIWYALNTILITVSYLDIYFCWIDLSVYLYFSTLISVLIFNEESKNFMEIIFDNSNLILSFILITAAAQLLLELMKKLKSESENLSVSNERIKESLEHIISLYQAIHSFTNQNRKDKLIAIIINYTQKITKSDSVFLGLKINQDDWSLETAPKDTVYDSVLLVEIKKQWDRIRKSDEPLNIYVNGNNYMTIAVKSVHKEYGVLGMKMNNKYNLEQIRFLSELSSMVFDNFQMEEIKAHLLVSEEQNRIANEIHDSVSQRLFSISCYIHRLIEKTGKIADEEQIRELDAIKDSLNKTMKDLRKTIYDLSWEKGGSDMFKLDIKDYLKEMSNLNGIDISFRITGNEELVNCDLKEAIYRIICEGTGNAVRHGKCSKVEIAMDITSEYIQLKISDNGIGFNYMKRNSGLGMKNMANLVDSFNGQMNVDSQIGRGTVINVLFNKNMYSEQGEVI